MIKYGPVEFLTALYNSIDTDQENTQIYLNNIELDISVHSFNVTSGKLCVQ
jgi:hypothetical protein